MTNEPESFDKGLIRELAELLRETGLSEIEIEHEGRRVRVARTLTLSGGAAAVSHAVEIYQEATVRLSKVL